MISYVKPALYKWEIIIWTFLPVFQLSNYRDRPKMLVTEMVSWLVVFYGTSTHVAYLMPNPVIYISKVGYRSLEQPEGSLFNSYYTEV